jgi:hypothetical protein
MDFSQDQRDLSKPAKWTGIASTILLGKTELALIKEKMNEKPVI